jgi:hypothetical protein
MHCHSCPNFFRRVKANVALWTSRGEAAVAELIVKSASSKPDFWTRRRSCSIGRQRIFAGRSGKEASCQAELAELCAKIGDLIWGAVNRVAAAPDLSVQRHRAPQSLACSAVYTQPASDSGKLALMRRTTGHS